MKRVTAILLVFLYLNPVVGITVKEHYCGGKLTSVSTNFYGSVKCPCGSKKMKKNCCKTKSYTICSKYSHQKTAEYSINFSYNFEFQSSIQLPECLNLPFAIKLNTLDRNYHPPNGKKQSIYLLNSVFRI
ncbi:MAG: hypothetical protein ABIO44_00945 [Saprospiraceae bacterium]